MSGLPPGTLGDAVGVLIYTFICLLSDAVLIWLLWMHRERLSYVALMAYFAQICTTSSIIQQIYHYTNYIDVLWAQLDYVKANYPNAEVIYKSGNFGFTLVLSNIRYFCYIMESTYLLTYTLHIAMSIYGVWASHRRAERIYITLSKIIPPILTGISIGLEYTPAVQRSWTAYMFVANVQAVAACAFSIVLIAMILWKYINSRSFWGNMRTGPMFGDSFVSWKAWMSKGWRSRSASATSAQTPQAKDRLPKILLDNNWLVWRLLIAILLISGFILATVLTQLPTPAQMAREVKTNTPDLSASNARSNIVGYIYGVTPGLAIPIVFGLTGPFRQTMYKTFVPKRWQKEIQSHEDRMGKAEGWGARAANTADSALESLQDSEYRAPGKLDSRPATSMQEWSGISNTISPTNSAEDLYELGVGTGRHEKQSGIAKMKVAKMRPGSSESTASLDPLLIRD